LTSCKDPFCIKYYPNGTPTPEPTVDNLVQIAKDLKRIKLENKQVKKEQDERNS